MISDDHRDSHGFTEGASKAQHDRSDNTDAGVAQDTDAYHLPASRSQGKRSFALAVGNCGHNVTGQRGDDRKNHDSEDHAGRQKSDTEVGTIKETRPAKG